MVVEVITYEYISYIPLHREMYIKNFKVCLTQFESIFINYLISNNGYCNMLDFEKYIYSLLKKNIPRKSLVVEINRLKRRVINQTGFPIIKRVSTDLDML